jgi:hypothetical protein
VGEADARELGVAFFSMDEFRAKGMFYVQHAGKNVRNFEDPKLWDKNALSHKLRAAFAKGFVCEGNHLLVYPQIAELNCERFYLDCDFATSLARRKTRNRGTAPDWSFAIVGESQTALHVTPQKTMPGVRVLDATRPAAELVGEILGAVHA